MEELVEIGSFPKVKHKLQSFVVQAMVARSSTLPRGPELRSACAHRDMHWFAVAVRAGYHYAENNVDWSSRGTVALRAALAIDFRTCCPKAWRNRGVWASSVSVMGPLAR